MDKFFFLELRLKLATDGTDLHGFSKLLSVKSVKSVAEGKTVEVIHRSG